MTIAFPDDPEEPHDAEAVANPRTGDGTDSRSAPTGEGPDSPSEEGRAGDRDRTAGWGAGAAEDLKPEALHEWSASGCTVAEARRWISDGYTAADAARWRRAGVYTPDAAREWRSAGLTPYTVDGALRAGMTPRDAVRWRELGYSVQAAAERHLAGESPHPKGWWHRFFGRRPVRFGEEGGSERGGSDRDGSTGGGGERSSARGGPGPTDQGQGQGQGQESATRAGDRDSGRGRSAAMRVLLHAGVTAATAREFVDAGWSGRAAIAWARRAVPPTDASIFDALGLSPAEGAQRLRHGEDAVSMMTDWWRADVPLDEVAAWAGAGFAPEEAAAMRADGVDVEQAAILRALGEDER
ncbi:MULTISPECIES: hypothetical protein [Actinoalloteichus]|uniref:Uncharacterized protein n=1 Tax=Actinoalloteichus fjordicus TaxID=1612552 RepID=A0AAC9LBU4_9PSEU|nr:MULTISPECIES: hypothetical protein [Actinoalloteichus]APU14712.1 hypothetical protein UA74_13270 [Actinoalloteichus fjordicus]APU20680.1 hypothetical protein UA75_13350 [Actinoalloteichus sp. GBA129-24]